MGTENKKSDHFVLVVDKQRELILHCLLESGFHNPIGNAIFQAFAQMHRLDMQEVESLIKELHDKRHEMGWCNDPNCKFKNKDNGDGNGKIEA